MSSDSPDTEVKEGDDKAPDSEPPVGKRAEPSEDAAEPAKAIEPIVPHPEPVRIEHVSHHAHDEEDWDDNGPNSLEHVEAPKTVDPEQIERRRFLARVSIGVGAGCGIALTVPMVGFVVAPLFTKAPLEWRQVGPVSEFKIGQTVGVTFMDASPLPWAGVTAKTAAWLRRVSETEFVAFTVHCAHLGCPVRWLPDANLFMCPCHGGVYYADGTVAAGPPPHPLSRYAVRVHEGFVEIRTDPIPID